MAPELLLLGAARPVGALLAVPLWAPAVPGSVRLALGGIVALAVAGPAPAGATAWGELATGAALGLCAGGIVRTAALAGALAVPEVAQPLAQAVGLSVMVALFAAGVPAELVRILATSQATPARGVPLQLAADVIVGGLALAVPAITAALGVRLAASAARRAGGLPDVLSEAPLPMFAALGVIGAAFSTDAGVRVAVDAMRGFTWAIGAR